VTLWAVRHNITSVAVDDLLGILRKTMVGGGLPSSSKTLLKTVNYVIQKWELGEYFHFGINRILLNMNISDFKCNESQAEPMITLTVGIDGLPISRSSKKQFWPILCKIDQLSAPFPFLVGLFYGDSQASDCMQLY
jgi:hypothetical protein